MSDEELKANGAKRFCKAKLTVWAKKSCFLDAIIIVNIAFAILSSQKGEHEAVSKTLDIDDATDVVQFECGEWTGLANEITKQYNSVLMRYIMY